MAILDEKMNGNILPVKLNLVLVSRGGSSTLLMMLSDLLIIAKAFKFKCHLRAFSEAPVQGQKGLRGFDLTSVKTEMMSTGRSFTLPPGGAMLNDAQKRPQVGGQPQIRSLASTATPSRKPSGFRLIKI